MTLPCPVSNIFWSSGVHPGVAYRESEVPNCHEPTEETDHSSVEVPEGMYVEERALGLGERLHLVFGVVVEIGDAGDKVVHRCPHLAIHRPRMRWLMAPDSNLLRTPYARDAWHDRPNEAAMQFPQQVDRQRFIVELAVQHSIQCPTVRLSDQIIEFVVGDGALDRVKRASGV
jgi:hypothetical protein